MFSEKACISYLKIIVISKFLYKLPMLYYDRIDVYEGIHVIKTSE